MMKVFVAGGSGAVGRRLVPRLVAEGYQVVAMTRDAGKARWLSEVGAHPVIADALDRAAVRAAVAGSEPQVVIHQLTALSGAGNYKQFDREFALTNRLRTEGTDYLLEGARTAGARRFIAQSYGNWNYARTGTGLKTEQDPFDATPPANQKQTLAAIRYMESAVAGAEGIEGIALRYGNFYGPGTGLAMDGAIVAQVRKRRLPIVGNGSGVWRSCTRTTRRPPQSPRSGTARPAYTTWPTTSRCRCRCGCRCWPRLLAPSHRCGCRYGWGGWPRATSGCR
jgi:2-alkyl-3-oxoalkanoate reductase